MLDICLWLVYNLSVGVEKDTKSASKKIKRKEDKKNDKLFRQIKQGDKGLEQRG